MPETVTTTITILNRLGLHARPAMMFVEAASKFDCDIRVRRCDQSEIVDGKSIMQMMMLAATNGTKIEIAAEGADASPAIEALETLVASRFQED